MPSASKAARTSFSRVSAALASATGTLLVVLAVVACIVTAADDLSLVKLALVLIYVVWWVVGLALVLLVGPALLCSTLLVAATRGVLNRARHG